MAPLAVPPPAAPRMASRATRCRSGGRPATAIRPAAASSRPSPDSCRAARRPGAGPRHRSRCRRCPHRRFPSFPVSGQPVSAAPVSGQPFGTPVSGQPFGTPVSGQPYSAQPLPSRPVPSAQAPVAPPAWPPVAAPEPVTPPVPERLAAALDMTTELPRVPSTEVPSTPATQPTTPPTPARSTPVQAQNRQQRYADETMELPIFRELESAWFRTRRSGSEETAGVAQRATNGAGSPANAAVTQQFSAVDVTGRPVQTPAPGTTGNAPMADTPMAGGMPRDNGSPTNGGTRPGPAEGFAGRRPTPQAHAWQTAADDGWRAASAATEVPVAETTRKGLPKRVPMAQLVPGGVEKPTTSVQRRTPEGVRGLLSAYHRGVQRGRTEPDGNPTNPEAAPGGQQSSQSGSGPVAGSGQKEQQG
ncbi:histidine kinase [Micromonospora sp. ATCC 39149]|nr:histidine kinase [Micromonospora sp. ATCC 39149]